MTTARTPARDCLSDETRRRVARSIAMRNELCDQVTAIDRKWVCRIKNSFAAEVDAAIAEVKPVLEQAMYSTCLRASVNGAQGGRRASL